MTSFRRFEDVPVWQEAALLYEKIESLLERADFLSRSFRNQMERAALSVSNNIAEGFERGTAAELIAFLYISRGSAGETRSMLSLLARKHGIANLRSQIAEVTQSAESCSRQLATWIANLRDSNRQGNRTLDKAGRNAKDARERALACERAILQALPADHPMRLFKEKQVQE